MKRIYLILSFVMLMASAVQAQNGTLEGVIYEAHNDKPVMFAMIKCETAPTGAYSDAAGKFTLDLPEGTHTISIDYNFNTQVHANIVIKAGEVTSMSFELKTQVQSATDGVVTITAARTQKTETAILLKQKNASVVFDGISSQTFKRAGASTAGQAVARVPGVSVQGGKHVVVRGLGDRYSKTLLNSMIIPGLDPDRNTVQMDVFPSSLLDNILVYKTFSPDLPADWAGGMVDMNTKAIPSKSIREFSLSMGYNPIMHLQDNYITYQGGSLDFLGFDDGTRALPFSKNLDLNAVEYDPTANNPELTELTRSFTPTLAPVQQKNTPDFGFSFSAGEKYVLKGDGAIGVNFTANYSKKTSFYNEAIYGTYIKSSVPTVEELLLNTDAIGPQSSQNIRWSALGGISYAAGNHSIRLSLLHSQNGESTAAQLVQSDYRENPSTIIKNNLEYTQRSVTNALLAGSHKYKDNKWTIDWKLSPTLSMIDEPDIRLTAFELTDDENPRFEINEGVGAVATRTYRNLIEQNYNAKLDITREFTLKNEEKAKLKFGFLETYKERDYEILNYQFRIQQESKFTFTGDADELLADHVLWTPNADPSNDSGVYVSGNREPANTYHAVQNIMSAYIMNELPVTNRFKAIYGVRMEQAQNFYTGSNQSRSVIYDHEKLLDEINFLPSVNLVFKLNAEMNLRTSYNHTLARPSFKELSNAQITDRISGRTFIGNDSLVQTNIVNYDLRWEYFIDDDRLPKGQMVSASAFMKTFENPIELVAYSASAPNDFQPRNVGQAQVYGVEFEFRKFIGFLTDTVNRVQFGTNLTLVRSTVEMTEAERAGRELAAREGEVINDTRDMVGQSPYIINAFLNVSNYRTGWEFNLSYNVQGPRLSIVGVSRNPDVYETPFHSLNVKLSKPLGEKNRFKCSISANNLLNSSRTLVYRSYGSSDKIFSELKPGRLFSLSLSYSL